MCIRDSFEAEASLVTEALRGLGVDARIGEVPGEYCPGRWSVNEGGRMKLTGTGQRVIHGGAHVGTVVVVEDAASIRTVLTPVYAALGLDWDPATVGAVADEVPGVTVAEVADALVPRLLHLVDATHG